MRKTIRIDGKRHSFDTSTARPIKHRAFGAFGDESGYEETLYRTRNGLFFVHGIGGATSPYPTEDIRAVSGDDATCWE